MENKTYFGTFWFVAFIGISFLFWSDHSELQSQKTSLKYQIEKLESEFNDKQSQKNELDACLVQANLSQSAQWDETCKLNGMKENCGLQNYISERIDKLYQNKKDDCFRQYPPK